MHAGAAIAVPDALLPEDANETTPFKRSWLIALASERVPASALSHVPG
jgi:hypothetical protein